MTGLTLRGSLVVATPALGDPNFSHTVVFILDATEQGALGVVLNRPSAIGVDETLPTWEPLAAHPRVMFAGGPVQPEAVVGLCRADFESEAIQLVAPGIGIVDLRADPLTLVGDAKGVRLFAGYAGWGDGQLESEVEQGGWFVLPPEPDDVFAQDPAQLWVGVLERQGGVYTTVSEDPSLN